MSIFHKQTKHETIIYVAIWMVLFLSPVLSLLANRGLFELSTNDWHELFMTWRLMFAFLVVFVVHNYVLAPLLVKRKKKVWYIVGCAVLVTLFFVNRTMKERGHFPQGPEPTEQVMPLPPPPPDMAPRGERPPIDGHGVMQFILLVMMMGANLGVQFYFKTEEDRKHLADLKELSLRQELTYLRYQINPHFIMNTLNNIHSLVDIDPEQAKDSIIDMSTMMRYLLYESDKEYVTLRNAIIYIKKFLKLMSIRYTDKVTIRFSEPEGSTDDVVIVPLTFMPFVENAFKHGVSYAKQSLIDIAVELRDGRVVFRCSNTKNDDQHEHGGVGITNVSKRLELIYGSDFTLDINDGKETYNVKLDVPARNAVEYPPMDKKPQ